MSSVRPYIEALALARLLYACESDDGDVTRLPPIAEAGKLLSMALVQARCEPGSLGARNAPRNAANGLTALARVGWSPEVMRLIETARRRLPPLER